MPCSGFVYLTRNRLKRYFLLSENLFFYLVYSLIITKISIISRPKDLRHVMTSFALSQYHMTVSSIAFKQY